MADQVEQGASAAHTQRLLLLAVVFTRMLAMMELTADVCVAWSHNGFSSNIALLTGAVIAESAALIIASLRRGSVSRTWAAADAVFIALGLVAFAQNTKPFDAWPFMFEISFTTAVTLGVTFRRLSSVLLWQSVPASAYAATALFERNAGWNVPQDLVSYLGLAVVIWALAREFLRWARALDQACAARGLRRSLGVTSARGQGARLWMFLPSRLDG